MKRPRPDNRLDWRDPQMPVFRNYTMRDGTQKTFVDPDYERQYREFMINASPQLSWREDPTYEAKRKRR